MHSSKYILLTFEWILGDSVPSADFSIIDEEGGENLKSLSLTFLDANCTVAGRRLFGLVDATEYIDSDDAYFVILIIFYSFYF
jgi:hypothetical protein